ncbi:TetR/AcrR family transcriptional regulator [Actinomycetota bacterium]
MRQELRDERRRHIGAAVIRLAASSGIGAVSLRSVASEADTSMGQVQYQFGSVADLLAYATELAVKRIEARVAADGVEGQDRLKLLARTLVTHDPELGEVLRAFAQLRTAAVGNERIGASVAGLHQRQRDEIADVLRVARSRRLLHSMVEPAAEADVFWTLLLSVAIEVAQGLRPADDGLATVRYHFLTLARSRRVTRPLRPSAVNRD